MTTPQTAGTPASTKVAMARYGMMIHSTTSRDSTAASHLLRRGERLESHFFGRRPAGGQVQGALKVARGRLGQDGADGVDDVQPRRGRVGQGGPQQFQSGPVLAEQGQSGRSGPADG